MHALAYISSSALQTLFTKRMASSLFRNNTENWFQVEQDNAIKFANKLVPSISIWFSRYNFVGYIFPHAQHGCSLYAESNLAGPLIQRGKPLFAAHASDRHARVHTT